MARIDPYQQVLDEIGASQADLREIRSGVDALREQISETGRRADALAAQHARDLDACVALGRFAGPQRLTDTLVLAGSVTARMRVRRLEVGTPVAQAFDDWLGVTHCATEAEDVRALWSQLLAREQASDGVLRGRSSTVLDIPHATLTLSEPTPRPLVQDQTRTLHVSMAPGRSGPARGVVAVPRFTYATPARKLRNFGHWLLDCVPQVVVLMSIAPDATVLLPGPLKPFHRWTLRELGLREEQLVEWDGSPVTGERLLAFESDGRTGGGRPLSALVELRKRLRAASSAPPAPGARRIYVSRRDARRRRQWVRNEAEIEALFHGRGFEVLSMAECPLDEQARIFREAGMVAGISGAGLTNLIFSPPGTQVIVLLSDSLIRWYAESGSRSLWARGTRGGRGQLAALGDSPRFYSYLAAAFEQVSHCFVGGDEMPLAPLAAFLDAVLERAAIARPDDGA